jgi:hypothetical protein
LQIVSSSSQTYIAGFSVPVSVIGGLMVVPGLSKNSKQRI